MEARKEGKDGRKTHICPRPQHPLAVLFNLQLLDIVVRQRQTDSRQDDRDATIQLRLERAAKRAAQNHQCANEAEEDEGEHDIAIDAMEQDHAVSYPRHELQAREC